MRIAVVAGKFPTYSETFVSGMVARLIDAGHDVEVIASRPGVGPDQPEVERLDLRSRTRYRARRALVGGAGRPGVAPALLAAARRPGLLSPTGFGADGPSLRAACSAVPWLGARPFDAVFCFFAPQAVLACRLRAAGIIAARTPIVGIVLGADSTSTPVPDLRMLVHEADAVLALSHYLRRKLVERGVPGDRVAIHRLGVDLADFNVAPAPPLAGDDPLRLLFVGRLVTWKAPDDAIRALAALDPDLRPRVRLDIIGDGPLRAELSRLVSGLGLEERVGFHGAQPRPIVQRSIHDAHALVLPSFEPPGGRGEGLGMVIVEALACGRPVIGADAGGIPELVVHERTGLLVPPRRPQAIAEAVGRLLEEPARIARYGAAGRTLVEREHNAHHQIHELVATLERLAAARA